jgi:hypothetical protein
VVFGGSYGGDLSMINHRTGESRSVDPWPDNPMGHAAIDLEHRFQWTYPIVFSPHDPNVLYTCSQYVLKTTDGGQSWKKISPDLTKNDPSTLGSSGGPITKDNTSVEYYGTVFTLGESPKKKGVIWAGSDDGLVHITQNGGASWANVTPPNMPKWGLVSTVEPSPSDAATAYIAIDSHENDDYAPYAYVTRDYGKTWQSITANLPKNSFVRVVREDPHQRNLLYAGTETGVWVSFDSGSSWQSLQLNLPLAPVHDLILKDDDLVVATHGRAFWILDDVTPLQQLARDTSNKIRFFAPKDAYRVRWGGGFGRRGRAGESGQSGENPMSGVLLSYYLPQDGRELRFEFTDSTGKVFQTVANPPKSKGFQRTSAFLQYPSYRTFPGMSVWSGFPSPIQAPPGEYTVTMVADGSRIPAKFKWLRDPRGSSTDADLRKQFEFLQTVSAKISEANGTVTRIRSLRSSLNRAMDEAKAKGDVSGLTATATTFLSGIQQVEEAIYQTKNRSGQDPLNYPIRLNDKLAGVFSVSSGGNFRPTDQAREVFPLLSKQLDHQLAKLKSLEANELKSINEELTKRGVKPVTVDAPPDSP